MQKQKIKVGSDELTPQPMVKWYDPGMLRQTGFQVAVSNIFGKYTDTRETYSRSLFPEPVDYSDKKGKDGFWLDYIADTGDGFNSTYSIAYLLQQKEMNVTGKDDQELTLPRGNVLVFGGDEVYPAASNENYMQKLWLPYESAFPIPKKIKDLTEEQRKSLPDLYAIPGNHDWYDGLNNFLKFFCQKRRLGGWQTQQMRSYFAAKLSDDLWIWGIDIQLEGGIDKLQLDYFHKIAMEKMNNNDRLILCTAEPTWVHINTKAGKKRFAKLNFFIRDCIENIVNDDGTERRLNLALLLSGDLHHYARYCPDDEKDYENLADQCITAGGGGAFMHPTHNLDETLSLTTHTQLKFQTSYPEKDESRAMSKRNLLFPRYNITLSLLLSVIMLIVILLTQSGSIIRNNANHIVSSVFDYTAIHALTSGWWLLLTSILINPLSILVGGIFSYGIYTFRDNEQGNLNTNKFFGMLHAAVHIFSGVTLTIILVKIFFNKLEFTSNDFFFYISFIAAFLVAGFIMHGLLFGGYLFFANRVLKCHDNEAFSHMAIEDHKNIIKLHITNDGDIEIFPIGIRKVCRSWNFNNNPAGEFGKPLIAPKQQIKCRLIEDKIVIRKKNPS